MDAGPVGLMIVVLIGAFSVVAVPAAAIWAARRSKRSVTVPDWVRPEPVDRDVGDTPERR